METKNIKVNWGYIAGFYIIAFVISAPFNSAFLSKNFEALAQNYLICSWTFLPAGFGTLIAAGLGFLFYKNFTRTISFFGNHPTKNVAIAVTPLVVFTLAGLSNGFRINEVIYGFSFAAFALIYATSEEIFWRGFLQDALRPLGIIRRYLFIGLLWWAWHFRFATTFDFTLFVLVCVGGAFLLGKFADDTKSFFAAAGMHSLLILTTTSGEMTNSRIIGGAVTIIIWLVIGKWWKTSIKKPE